MEILVMGAGFTGCSLARLLKDKGYDILIREMRSHIGGLCYTQKSPNGIFYEPFGAHTFHTKDEHVKKFVQRFAKFNNYVHNKGVVINSILRHYPISIETIKKLPESNQILKELDCRPKNLISTNFETYMKSIFGKTLYNLFIYNYTKKMWGVEPRELTSEWVRNRVDLREKESELFKGQWQGLPIGGYTKLFENMINGIPIEYYSNKFSESDFDLILYSGKIDELFDYKFGVLSYRSLKFDYKEDDHWENENYGTINLPQHPKYIRKVNFKLLHQQKTNCLWIQYQEPNSADGINLPMYPIRTKNNIALFNKYLKEACKTEKIIPIGRLGLYIYLDMDKAVKLAFDMIPLIENWRDMNAKERYFNIESSIAKL